MQKCSQSLLEIDHMTKIGDGNTFKMAAAAILNSVFSPITRLLLDVFARNMAGGLNFTSYIQLCHNIKQSNIQYGDGNTFRHFVFLHET